MLRKNPLAKMNIRDIRNDFAILEDGTLITILRCKGTNYSLKKVCLLRKWIETLNYPTQISAITYNLGLTARVHTYLGSVEHRIKQKKGTEHLLNDQKQFSEWLKAYVAKNCQPERLFYVVIKVCPYYEKKKELRKLTSLEQDSSILKKRTLESLEKLSVFMDIRQLRGDEVEKMLTTADQFVFYNNQSERFMNISDCYDLWREGI